MRNLEDLTGRQFGRLTVLGEAERDMGKGRSWFCKCSCGNTIITTTYKLKHGVKKSCGCLQREIGRINFTKHGEAHSRLHEVWKGIKSRCYNPKHSSYKNYGGRGIEMCNEWKDNYACFRDFMLSIGYDDKLPSGQQTVERIDVNGNYEPKNCTLITKAEQNFNKRSNHLITYKGVTKTITEFANELKLDVDTILNRINNYGYTIEEALERPIRKCSHKNAPKYEVDGEVLTLREWAEKFDMTRSQFKSKIRRKSVEEAVRELKSNLQN